MFYKLDENKNVVSSSVEEWASFIENTFPTNYRKMAEDIINGKIISTVFIGICHNYDPRSKVPLVFETMIFEEDLNPMHYQERYSTWQEAEEGHKRAIQWLYDLEKALNE